LGKKTNKTRPYLNKQICLEQEEYEEFLFILYFYVQHNLNILVYKHDAQLVL